MVSNCLRGTDIVTCTNNFMDLDAKGVLFSYVTDEEPNCWGVPFSRAEFHPKFIPKDAGHSFHTLAFKELFPLEKEFAEDKVDPDKQQAYMAYQQALSKLSQGVISNAVKLEAGATEKDLNAKIVQTIILSLLGQQGYCLMNKDHKCSGVTGLKTPDECKVEGLWIGFEGALFGEPDWFASPRGSEDFCVAGIGTVEADDDEDDDDEDDDDNNDEPASKKHKGTEDDNSPDKNEAVERKVSSTSQAIATCIGFSFVYRSRHPKLTKFIPTILTSNQGFVVLLYDSEMDVLLKCGLPWSRQFLLVLWAVLNYQLFLNSAKVNGNLKFGYSKNNGRYTLKKVAPEKMKYLVECLHRPSSTFQQQLYGDTIYLKSGGWKVFI